MTLISVVIPTRDRSALLTTTLRSVLWQRDVDLEVIVVEDASTDDTARMVAGLGDPRVTLVRREVPRGPSAARNDGATRARGEWLAFVDDDDVWAPGKLASQVAAADGTGRDWVYAGAVSVGADLEVASGTPPPDPEEVVVAIPRYNAVPGGGSNVMLRRALFEKVGGFDERFPPCEDWELWIRLTRSGAPASVRPPLVGYRLHGESSSLDTDRIRRAARLIERVHGTRVDWGRLHRWLGESCLRVDRRPAALGHLAQAALRGQAGGVASDLLAIVRRRMARRRRGGRQRPLVRASDGWAAEASAWLEDLRRLTAGADDVGPR